MAESWSWNEPIDAVVGLRRANAGSGVGLFNRRLARRLGVPNVRLLEARPFRRPLVSLKFEELSAAERDILAHLIADRRGQFSLFLHSWPAECDAQDERSYQDESAYPSQCSFHGEFARHAVAEAARIFCGNRALHQQLSQLDSALPLVEAFAPSLIRDRYRRTCQPASIELFAFGMASKVDQERYARLAHLLNETGLEYRLLASLSVHQASDGTCLRRALDFFRGCFGDRFIPLGCLSDQGIAYLLNGGRTFVGFYPDGVRANNTTFNTAIRFGCPVVTNVDRHSPPETRRHLVLDFDRADAAQLATFLAADRADSSTPSPSFGSRGQKTWSRLIRTIQGESVPRRSAA